MKHQLPPLGYAYNSLEPYIDARTMEIHYSKHHQAYVDNLNKALEGTDLENKEVEELLKYLEKLPRDRRKTIRNNAGGHFNHSFFWRILKKDVKIGGIILERINKEFGGVEEFRRIFKSCALSLFGSGWVWLVLNKKGRLKIIQTKNQDTPLSKGEIPLIACDVWEHAYYLKYQNRRGDYIDAFFNVINWEEINKILLNNKDLINKFINNKR
ncbi:MAG: superoxide dismutase [Candidatus Pacearchaeota archaeon]